MYDRPDEPTNYELTFVAPNGDWTWQRHFCKDYHEAICKALMLCPDECRVHGISRVPVTTANEGQR